jgi:HSP20 family molecular chaperone IbpA
MSDTVTMRQDANQRNGSSTGLEYRQRAVSPPVDVFENADELLLIADVPGVAGDALDLRVENDTLTLQARRSRDLDAVAAPALAREYDEVDFVRGFRIPAGIDAATISAEAKNGTVIVRLPKTAAAKPRKIAVRTS